MTDAERLVDWFRANARPLPWRTEVRDPYRSLLSELMAQQTRIDRVVPRFEAFVARFPDLASLAAANEDDVVEAWSGLGYYRRARMLHRLAREVAATGGELPRTPSELEALPGVGPYTAAALASLVFGQPVPLVDGNVARVGSRVLALDSDPRSSEGRAAILEWVRALMADAPPGPVNEGLMELGARICTPSGPHCGRCPLAGTCRARADGRPEAFPVPRDSRPGVELEWVAAVVEGPGGRWLLRRVEDGPILRGLWLPPFAERDPARGLGDQARDLVPVEIAAPPATSPPVRHAITYRRLTVAPVRFVAKGAPGVAPGWRWADPESPRLPTSSLLGKLLRSVRS